MQNLFYKLFAALVAKLLTNKEAFWTAIVHLLEIVRKMAVATPTLLDDLLVHVLITATENEDVRELLNEILDRLVALLNRDVPAASIADDPETVAHLQFLSDKVGVNWQKLIELLLKILPLILPFILDEDEADAT